MSEAADVLDKAVAVVLRTLGEAPPRGHYEAELEANLMIGLIIRHAEAVGVLARDHVVLYPAAMTVARAAYEAALRALWMLDPEAPFERERRWLAHLENSERLHTNLAGTLSRAGFRDEAERNRRLAEGIRSFRLGVIAELPEGISPPEKLPKLERMVSELGREERYLPYRIASQYAHATHFATGVYRKNLGVAIETGEFIEPERWRTPISLAWFALEAPTKRLLECLAGDVSSFDDALPRQAMARVMNVLRLRSPDPFDPHQADDFRG